MSIFWGLDAMGSVGPARHQLARRRRALLQRVRDRRRRVRLARRVRAEVLRQLPAPRRPLGFDDLDPDAQMDMAQWPALKVRLRRAVPHRARATSGSRSSPGTEVCFAPVLPMTEARAHPHNVAREMFVDVDGAPHPAPAPRFSRTPTAVQGAPVEARRRHRHRARRLGLRPRRDRTRLESRTAPSLRTARAARSSSRGHGRRRRRRRRSARQRGRGDRGRRVRRPVDRLCVGRVADDAPCRGAVEARSSSGRSRVRRSWTVGAVTRCRRRRSTACDRASVGRIGASVVVGGLAVVATARRASTRRAASGDRLPTSPSRLTQLQLRLDAAGRSRRARAHRRTAAATASSAAQPRHASQRALSPAGPAPSQAHRRMGGRLDRGRTRCATAVSRA